MTFDTLKREVLNAELIGASRHAAAIVHKGDIISIGHNKRKTHPLMLKFQHKEHNLFLHAEIDAISKIRDKKLLTDCSLYVMRLSKGNNISNSEPCQTCWNAIRFFGIKPKNVYWSRINCHKF